jgi:hypothetical protein
VRKTGDGATASVPQQRSERVMLFLEYEISSTTYDSAALRRSPCPSQDVFDYQGNGKGVIGLDCRNMNSCILVSSVAAVTI